MKNSRSLPPARRQAGFSLVELSMVLVIIALIVGAVTVGANIQRNASYQKLGASIRGWQQAYLAYKTKWGVTLLDSQVSPTGFVNQNTTGEDDGGTAGEAEVCGSGLRAAMLEAGVKMPLGRAEGKESYYAYLDSNGNPQEMEVCFRSIPWLTETATPGTYATQVKNVMVIKRVTPDLARLIDSMFDNARDAQFGSVRQYPGLADGSSYTSPAPQAYGLDNTCVQGAGCGVAYDEAQVATTTIYYLLDD